VLVFIDIPPAYVIGGTVVAGVCVLIGTGALPLADLHPSQIRAALKGLRGRRRPSPPKNAPKSSRFSLKLPDFGQARTVIATFSASIRQTVAKGRAPEHVKKAELSKIDAMLDQTLSDPLESEMEPGSRGSGGSTGDPLSALEELDTESLDDLDLDGEVSRIASKFTGEQQTSMLSEEEEMAVADILKAHRDDLDDLDLPAGLDFGDDAAGEVPVAAIPAGNGAKPGLQALSETLPEDVMGSLDAGADAGLLSDDLSALDDLDLDEIEIDDGPGEESDSGGSHDLFAAPEEPESAEDEEEEEPEESFDMVSFASGGLADDDLMAELKADVKKRKVVEDISLVRDLKGIKYSAQELADEMEDLLRMMKPKQ
jgi:hypothetical protein